MQAPPHTANPVAYPREQLEAAGVYDPHGAQRWDAPPPGGVVVVSPTHGGAPLDYNPPTAGVPVAQAYPPAADPVVPMAQPYAHEGVAIAETVVPGLPTAPATQYIGNPVAPTGTSGSSGPVAPVSCLGELQAPVSPVEELFVVGNAGGTPIYGPRQIGIRRLAAREPAAAAVRQSVSYSGGATRILLFCEGDGNHAHCQYAVVGPFEPVAGTAPWPYLGELHKLPQKLPEVQIEAVIKAGTASQGGVSCTPSLPIAVLSAAYFPSIRCAYRGPGRHYALPVGTGCSDCPGVTVMSNDKNAGHILISKAPNEDPSFKRHLAWMICFAFVILVGVVGEETEYVIAALGVAAMLALLFRMYLVKGPAEEAHVWFR